MTTEPRTIDPATLFIDLEPVPTGQVVDGHPIAGSAAVGTIDGVEVGVWEHTTGTTTDVEAEELSVILSGSATVVINDAETVELSAGTILRLREGDRTLWTVTETLRKVYVVRS